MGSDRQTALTRFVNPIKLREYAAAGLPVVSTDLPEVRRCADIATCATDSTGNLYCNEDTVSMTRIAGTSKFLNVSQQLLYIYADINGDGVIDRVPLFSSQLQDYYWQLDSQGRMHAQVKFCPVSTVVP